MTPPPHARAFDLPGWPCPPRVRDIPNHQDSWGWVPISNLSKPIAVAIDELGHLWANGDVIPAFKLPNESNANPGALLSWDPAGLALWVHPRSLQWLPNISRLDMQADQWLPIAVALAEPPPQAKAST